MTFRIQENRESGHRLAAEKTKSPRWCSGGVNSANLEVIWECRLSDRGRILFLVAIMAVVAVITAIISLGMLHQTALDEGRSRLVNIAQNQARLIEAMARFDQAYSQTDIPGGAIAATLSQITHISSLNCHQQLISDHCYG